MRVLPQIRCQWHLNNQEYMQPQLPALIWESNKCFSGRDAWVVKITCGQHSQEGFTLWRTMWTIIWQSCKLKHLICLQKSLQFLLPSDMSLHAILIPTLFTKCRSLWLGYSWKFTYYLAVWSLNACASEKIRFKSKSWLFLLQAFFQTCKLFIRRTLETYAYHLAACQLS